ncbi:uncharacterized protein CCOS01_06627 [Colletotrichum costaricense]|uniref:Uncharacterized protein n=1 Tax=Colletotrichum costaricense TaxID=1209916 RepID=A0AAJ0E0V3_9PEZI|nr:uncharacterized protein CCOS01_06627 [Colletotrichum costaricense]KAK1528793.1 hypothetical protein CCOS01_06627 [Colletotrichum costaricense]
MGCMILGNPCRGVIPSPKTKHMGLGMKLECC